MPLKCDEKKVNTRYGMFQIASTLSFRLNPVGFTTSIITNIPELSISPFTTLELPKLPLSFISEENDVVPKNWVHSLKMKELFWPLLKLLSRTHMF